MTELLTRPDVLSVSLGYPVRGGEWKQDEIAICVHVVRKHDRKELDDQDCIPERICGLPTDVFELDSWLESDKDHTLGIRGPDLVRDGSTRKRFGAITAALPVEDGTLVLASGHVVLPQQNGRIAREFTSNPAYAPVQARFIVHDDGEYPGSVLEGELGGDRDWGLVFFRYLKITQTRIFRLPASASFPLRCHGGVLFPGERVYQLPNRERECGMPSNPEKWIRGRIARCNEYHKSLPTADGTTVPYHGLISVMADTTDRFSCRGDSGSGVYDQYGRLAGTVVGGGIIRCTERDLTVSFIAPINPLRERFREHSRARSFFE